MEGAQAVRGRISREDLRTLVAVLPDLAVQLLQGVLPVEEEILQVDQ